MDENQEENTQEVAVEEKAEKLDIKETVEAVDGFFALTLFIASRLKDGAGVDDAIALFTKASTDAEFKAVIEKAYDGKEKIPAEVKDIDLMEGVVLGKKALEFVPQLLEAIKK